MRRGGEHKRAAVLVAKCIGFSDAFHDGHRHALQCVASEKRQWTKSRMGYRSGSAGAMGICRWADGGQRVEVPNTRVFLLNSERHDCPFVGHAASFQRRTKPDGRFGDLITQALSPPQRLRRASRSELKSRDLIDVIMSYRWPPGLAGAWAPCRVQSPR